ncbi:MAG: HNH endonuclease [Anaerolineae bacterium]|nr:HNH endonuclease [Anaerolineae bacterium]
MPHSPRKPCAIESCPGRATHGRYCADCSKQRQQKQQQRSPDTRPSAARRGYDAEWRRIRAQFLKAHGECVVCGDTATEADHILSLANGGTHQWSNLQPMCKTHHSQKTAVLDGGFGEREGRGGYETS